MRKLSADFIYTMVSEPISGGALVLDNAGKILAILKSAEGLDDVEYFKGILCPGFINTHCHLELSHLKGKIKKHTGLPEFIKSVTNIREEIAESDIQAAIIDAETVMINNGIVAVGDISNTTKTFIQKGKRKLEYHTFIEAIGFLPSKAESAMNLYLNLEEDYKRTTGLSRVSIVPHAPYSVSGKLFQLISNHAKGNVISMHNQESQSENEMFLYGSGKLVELLRDFFKMDLSFWKAPQTHSLRYIFSQVNPSKYPFVAVHNTYSTKEDINYANRLNKEMYWCLCPKANLYIEKKLPDVEIFRSLNCQLTLGTDSLASNDSLCILEEIKILSQTFPNIPTIELIKWATINGADALNMPHLGRFEPNLKPGINLIQSEKIVQLDKNSTIKKIA